MSPLRSVTEREHEFSHHDVYRASALVPFVRGRAEHEGGQIALVGGDSGAVIRVHVGLARPFATRHGTRSATAGRAGLHLRVATIYIGRVVTKFLVCTARE